MDVKTRYNLDEMIIASQTWGIPHIGGDGYHVSTVDRVHIRHSLVVTPVETRAIVGLPRAPKEWIKKADICSPVLIYGLGTSLHRPNHRMDFSVIKDTEWPIEIHHPDGTVRVLDYGRFGWLSTLDVMLLGVAMKMIERAQGFKYFTIAKRVEAEMLGNNLKGIGIHSSKFPEYRYVYGFNDDETVALINLQDGTVWL